MSKKNHKQNTINMEKENMYLEEALLEFDMAPSRSLVISNSSSKNNYLLGMFSRVKE